MPSVDELIAIKERVEADYLGRPGVTGIDVGYKEVGGERTSQVAIRIHVEHKTDEVPADERVPARIDDAVTDVLERRYELHIAREAFDVSLQADTTHYTTLQGGISMGPSRAINGFIFAGTLGAIVIDKANNQHAALTNFHVACVDNGWNVGDRMVQPSRIDTGIVPTDEFGAIARATLSGHVDGAVISIDSGRATSCGVVDIGQIRGTKAAALGVAVRKRGRTTGLTYGSVDGLSLSVSIDYGDGLGVHTLTNQVSIAADTSHNALFSDHGDSGSVIVDGNGYVVALLFGGAGSSTVGNPVADVLSELNIDMCVGKSLLKDVKDGRKDFIKDKELRKELVKDKELRKEIIKELRKDVIPDTKGFKDLRDGAPKRIADNLPPGDGDPGPLRPPAPGGQSALEQRLAVLEARLGSLEGFVSADLRPDLTGAAFIGEPDLTEADIAQLRDEAERQAADAAAAKADLDAPLG
jgi:hypothetical protein